MKRPPVQFMNAMYILNGIALVAILLAIAYYSGQMDSQRGEFSGFKGSWMCERIGRLDISEDLVLAGVGQLKSVRANGARIDDVPKVFGRKAQSVLLEGLGNMMRISFLVAKEEPETYDCHHRRFFE